MIKYNKQQFKQYLSQTRMSWCLSNKIEYMNEPVSFDIETTSTYYNDSKHCYMYLWQFGIHDCVFYGRTWDEFIEMINTLTDYYGTGETRKIIIYVHNLSFEFAFLCQRMAWKKVFCVKSRTPVYAETETGLLFKCSYLLTNYSLDSVGKNLINPIPKLIGDLDYSLIHNSTTPLTDAELSYAEHDILIVMQLIREKIEQDGNITKIPLTNTGYVRKTCKQACLSSKNQNSISYRKFIQQMTITPDEYIQLVKAFQGGFTHASNLHSGQLLTNVTSFDLSSAYPSVLVGEQYPMSKGEYITVNSLDELETMCKDYLLVFDIMLDDVQPKFIAEHYLSFSKCYNVPDDAIVDNGRIVSASHLVSTITNIDYEILKQCYTWKSISVSHIIRYRKSYLPTPFIKTVLQFYNDKTSLKCVSGKEVQYMHSKGMLNSLYGCCVCSLCKENETFIDGSWTTENEIKASAIKHIRNKELSKGEYDSIAEDIEKNNLDKNRYLFYAWGVFCTAYCRRNIWELILKTGYNNDYVYSDTDSVKVLNGQIYTEYIKKWNNITIDKMVKSALFHGLTDASVKPKTIKGVEKPLGVFECDGVYNRFKTYGAKRYMYETDGHISITVSGVNKSKALPYLQDITNNNNDAIFSMFEDGLQIPPEHTGKLTHTYIDDKMDGISIDYLGNKAEYHELSGVHLESAPFEMGVSADYMNYLMSIMGNTLEEEIITI